MISLASTVIHEEYAHAKNTLLEKNISQAQEHYNYHGMMSNDSPSIIDIINNKVAQGTKAQKTVKEIVKPVSSL